MAQFTAAELAAAPSLAGKMRRGTKLTDFERAVANYQGLLGPDGALIETAYAKPEAERPTVEATPVEHLIDDPTGLLEELEQAKLAGSAKTMPAISTDSRIDEPLAAPGTVDSLDLTKLTAAQIEIALRSAQTPIHCPHCAHDQRAIFAEPPVTPEDKAAFIRHIFSTGRFFKTFQLFGGEITLQLRSRTSDEATKVYEHVRAAATKQTLGAADVVVRMQQLFCANAVAEITFGKERKVFDVAGERTPDVVYTDVFGGERAAALYNAVFTVYLEFERLYDWLTSRASDPNFWKTAVGSHS